MREARPAMERGDFRRRCEAALAHPVTLVALALLLVNDIVLKALFPGAWAMGKLSDLAWVVFAPPLLAFALSFAVPKRSAAGRRAALIIAYGGLPLLYAAFNTFAPVHDAIMNALLIGAESGALGSPMDATDSLVIPFGLALAIWARRKSAESDGGGGTRWRLGLLVAGVAAFASVASSLPPTDRGITSIGVSELDDGVILATAYVPYGYRSDDGGMSWSENNDHFPSHLTGWTEEYAISDDGVERVGEGGQRELVYSTEYLRADANKWMQENRTRNFGYRELTTRPNQVIYHAASGNVVVNMGIQGVAVGTPDGRWRRVVVGPYSPTDFSFSAKMSALRESGWTVGEIALALSLSALATAAAVASAYERDEAIGGAFAAPTALVGSLGATLIIAAMRWTDGGSPFLMFVAVLLSWITGIIAVSKSNSGPRHKYALLACVSTLTLSVALLFSFGIPENECCSYVGFAKSALLFATVASMILPFAYSSRFIARNWRAFGLAFLGMNALIILSFAMWLTLNLSLLAAQTAIAILVGLAAVVLVRHVRGAGGW